MWTMKRSLACVMVLVQAQAALGADSFPLIAGYQPLTDVTDEARIDLDQIMFQQVLSGYSAQAFDDAQNIYQRGGYSQSISKLKLYKPLPYVLPAGIALEGKDESGKNTIALVAYGSNGLNENSIDVQYINEGDEGCFLGGLPSPETNGCLASNGTLFLDGNNTIGLSYTYNVLDDTFNGRTISTLSTDKASMKNSDLNVYWPDFQKFYTYYGTEEYADEWIISALKGEGTSYKNGNAYFNSYDMTSRAEAAQKGTVLLTFWMTVILRLESAVLLCEKACLSSACENDSVNALDQAVAFYTGAQELSDGSGYGVLMYEFASARAVDFKTAGPKGDSVDGTAKVNIDIFNQFNDMKRLLMDRDCVGAMTSKEIIAQKMAIPLVQGALRYAYITDIYSSSSKKEEVEGAVYAAAVLPIVANCNSNDASIIYQNLKTGQGNTCDYVKVKAAFEKNYNCMGITTSDVGGYWDSSKQDYFPGASPSASKKPNVGLAVGLSLGGLFAAVVIWAFCVSKNFDDLKESNISSDVVSSDRDEQQCEHIEPTNELPTEHPEIT